MVDTSDKCLFWIFSEFPESQRFHFNEIDEITCVAEYLETFRSRKNLIIRDETFAVQFPKFEPMALLREAEAYSKRNRRMEISRSNSRRHRGCQAWNHASRERRRNGTRLSSAAGRSRTRVQRRGSHADLGGKELRSSERRLWCWRMGNCSGAVATFPRAWTPREGKPREEIASRWPRLFTPTNETGSMK